MTETQQPTSSSRMVSMDFVRVLALFGVILFHASGAYANIPYWSVQNGTSIVAIGIRELVDVFIMPLFFFLAGYFTLSSLRKKGSWGFFKSKFWELGLCLDSYCNSCSSIFLVDSKSTYSNRQLSYNLVYLDAERWSNPFRSL